MTNEPPTAEGFRAYWEARGWKGTWSAQDDRVGGFYVPMLERARAYDRMAGYFTSSALSLAAAGLSSFVANGGVMRLIVGAQLDRDDVAAIERGEPLVDAVTRALLRSDAVQDAAGVVAEHRRNVLGWLVKEGRLVIKVGVPIDPSSGRPLRPAEATKYFHSKYGIFTDCVEVPDRVAFIGSDNETWSGWVGNHETFVAAPTWHGQTWEHQGAGLVAKFEAHWRDRPDEGWKVLDLDEAVKNELVKWEKSDLPPFGLDPEVKPVIEAAELDPRLVELAAAPEVDGGSFVGMATAGVEPLPHQTAMVKRIVETWPRGYLLADEVGLGKTIEAGFVIRELLLAKKAERFLLLVPAAVLRQWQEELAEKISLRVNRYEGGAFYDPENREVPFSGPPWSAFPIVLASSHLARRGDRQRQVLAGGPWDLVLIDEAHHARRRGGKPNGTPNNLLALALEMRREQSFKALMLASATPMQMHPHEAWDLVELLGLPGRWAQSATEFIRYFDDIARPFGQRHWGFLSSMAKDHFGDPQTLPDPSLDRELSRLGLVKATRVRKVSTDGLTQSQARGLDEPLQPWVDRWLQTNNPMRERLFRNTRRTLRYYQEAGLLPPETVIPVRDVDDKFIDMTPEESELYERIRTYIRRSYNRFQSGTKARRALGFIMTVYRRRLTSSFRAIQLSLERRLDVLEGRRVAADLLDEDDVIADPALPIEELERTPHEELEAEIFELKDFIKALKCLPPDESKMRCLHELIEDAFVGGHETVLVFTQYADTMNYLVEQLSTAYGSRVMSYSGSGGRRRDPQTGAWMDVSKKETKNLFRAGVEIKILIGTDSLSEGLNLQTCGRLINYDMPWNFMRVEQRIGRVDRINGQPVVSVTNLFYKDTIEEQIYRGLVAGHKGFEWIVGNAQPILAAVEQAIIDHELGPTEESATLGITPGSSVESLVAGLQGELEAAGDHVLLEDLAREDPDPEVVRLEPKVTLADVERTLLGVPTTRSQLFEHPSIGNAWLIEDEAGNKVPVTLDRGVLAEHAPEMRLLTFGDPLFDLLLRRAGVRTPPLNEAL